MFYRLRDTLQRSRFDFLCRHILRTPPLKTQDAPLFIVSQVSHRDILMYLVAIKSIYRFLGKGRIVVLDDGSLAVSDRELLTQHLPGCRTVSLDEVGVANTPRRGCWERLLLISQLVKSGYVMQVDSDSLTLDAIPEVVNHIKDNCSFTLLGAGSIPKIESMLDACARARLKGQLSAEPQAVGERLLDQFPNCTNEKYVRGNAAFAGFAQGSFSSVDVERYSKQMEMICGRTIWHKWGSEQVTSNLIIANCGRAAILPSPKYVSYYALADTDYDRSSFLHFMGTHRFEHGYYARRSRRIIQQMTPGVGDVLKQRAQPDGNTTVQFGGSSSKRNYE